jgi:hypothetical protein
MGDASERATAAERRWSAAKQAGDEAERIAALREYREAWRELRRVDRETPDPKFLAWLRAELLSQY